MNQASGDSLARSRMRSLTGWATQLETTAVPAQARVLDSLTLTFFELGPYVAACPAQVQEYILISSRLREGIPKRTRADRECALRSWSNV